MLNVCAGLCCDALTWALALLSLLPSSLSSRTSVHIIYSATARCYGLMSGVAGTPRHVVLPKEKGLEREAVSWYTHMYPRTQAPDWPSARPVDIIQVLLPNPLPQVPPQWGSVAGQMRKATFQ